MIGLSRGSLGIVGAEERKKIERRVFQGLGERLAGGLSDGVSLAWAIVNDARSMRLARTKQPIIPARVNRQAPLFALAAASRSMTNSVDRAVISFSNAVVTDNVLLVELNTQ